LKGGVFSATVLSVARKKGGEKEESEGKKLGKRGENSGVFKGTSVPSNGEDPPKFLGEREKRYWKSDNKKRKRAG